MPRGSPHDQAENNKKLHRAGPALVGSKIKATSATKEIRLLLAPTVGAFPTATARRTGEEQEQQRLRRPITINKHATLFRGELRLPSVLSGSAVSFRTPRPDISFRVAPGRTLVTLHAKLFDTTLRFVHHPAVPVLESAQVSRLSRRRPVIPPHSCPSC